MIVYVIMTGNIPGVIKLKKVIAVILLMICNSAYAETRARFLFIGDIMVHDQQLDAARKKDMISRHHSEE